MPGSVPLIALEAVVLDTETTGLDPAKARVLQIGMVRISGGALEDSTAFERKCDPGVPIPPETTRIHGLDAAALAGAPPFAAHCTEVAAFIGGRVVIGHNLGFDLAVLGRECAIAREPVFWQHMLDTRLLGEICFPRLGGFTLDKLASHLGLSIEGRHDALADARLTARLFLALVPELRKHGIRTLFEAETACRRLTAVLDDYGKAGWVEPLRQGIPAANPLERIDPFPFRHRVADIASKPPVFAPSGTKLREAIRLMAERRISSVFVPARPERPDEPAGILTERDVIHLIGSGENVLDREIGPLASRPLVTVPAEAFIYRAIGRMSERGIRHLGVADEGGALVGALSARDLMQLRASDALALGDAIDNAGSVSDLAAAWARMPRVAGRLVAEAVPARDIAAVISREIGALTRRAAEEAERRLAAAGLGAPPAPYAVLLLGSGGRGESLLVPDQDNAIIHGGGAEAEGWFQRLGAGMNAILDEIGIPLCKGGVMAGNPEWNGDPALWRARLAGWTESITPEDLLSVDIFFDFRPVAGDAALAAALRADALEIAAHARPMVKLLAGQLASWSPPLGFMGRLVTDQGRVDLKKGGLFPIVAAARCLALSRGIAERGTRERIAALRAAGIGADPDLAMMDRAHGFFADLILRQQIADIAEGRAPTTRVDPRRLDREELAALKENLAALRPIPMMVRDLLFHA